LSTYAKLTTHTTLKLIVELTFSSSFAERSCPPTEQQTVVCDFADVKTNCGIKRKSGEDSCIKKKQSKQLLFTNVKNVSIAFQKLSGWLDTCSSKQQELGQKLKTALCDDRNFMEPED
jgi:hypothetical protein